MKTSQIADSLVHAVAAARKMFEAGGVTSAHPLSQAIRAQLDGVASLADALAEDAHAREAAAEAVRDDAARQAKEPPPVFGRPQEPAPTGHGIVATDVGAPSDASPARSP